MSTEPNRSLTADVIKIARDGSGANYQECHTRTMAILQEFRQRDEAVARLELDAELARLRGELDATRSALAEAGRTIETLATALARRGGGEGGGGSEGPGRSLASATAETRVVPPDATSTADPSAAPPATKPCRLCLGKGGLAFKVPRDEGCPRCGGSGTEPAVVPTLVEVAGPPLAPRTPCHPTIQLTGSMVCLGQPHCGECEHCRGPWHQPAAEAPPS